MVVTYCLRVEGDQKFVKFGITKDIYSRIKALENGSHPLDYYCSHVKIWSSREEALSLEKLAFSKFAQSRKRGEWFYLDGESVNLLDDFLKNHFQPYSLELKALLDSRFRKKLEAEVINVFDRCIRDIEKINFIKTRYQGLIRKLYIHLLITKSAIVNLSTRDNFESLFLVLAYHLLRNYSILIGVKPRQYFSREYRDYLYRERVIDDESFELFNVDGNELFFLKEESFNSFEELMNKYFDGSVWIDITRVGEVARSFLDRDYRWKKPLLPWPIRTQYQ